MNCGPLFPFLYFAVLKTHNRCYFTKETNKTVPVSVEFIVINQRTDALLGPIIEI